MSITGNLRTLEFEELLQWLAQGRKTGTLTIANGTIQKSISLKNGRIIASASSDPKERLGRFLVDQGYIDDSTLEHALKLQEATQISVGKVLVSLGSLSEGDLGRLLRQKTEESIYDLFFWPEGEFEFHQEEPSRLAMVPLSLDVTQVLLEGMRRMDEWKAGHDGAEEPLAGPAEERPREAGATTVAIEPPPLSDPTEKSEVEAPETDSATAFAWKEDPEEVPGERSDGSQRKIVTSIAASLLAVAGLGWALVSLRASEPGPRSSERSGGEQLLVKTFPPPHSLTGQSTAVPASSDPESNLALAAVAPPVSAAEEVAEKRREQELKARYEEELAALRRQLAEARRVASDETRSIEAPGPVAEKNPPSEKLVSVETPEIPARDRQTATAESFASGSPAEPVARPSTALKAPDGRGSMISGEAEETGVAETRLPPVTSQPAVMPSQKPAPPPAPPAPKTRRGDLVTLGPGVEPPKLVQQPSPRYPPAAERMGREGLVRLRVLVGENGRPQEVRQVGPQVGLGFDKAAVKAAKDAVWEPARKDGVRVKMWFDLVIQFKP